MKATKTGRAAMGTENTFLSDIKSQFNKDIAAGASLFMARGDDMVIALEQLLCNSGQWTDVHATLKRYETYLIDGDKRPTVGHWRVLMENERPYYRDRAYKINPYNTALDKALQVCLHLATGIERAQAALDAVDRKPRSNAIVLACVAIEQACTDWQAARDNLDNAVYKMQNFQDDFAAEYMHGVYGKDGDSMPDKGALPDRIGKHHMLNQALEEAYRIHRLYTEALRDTVERLNDHFATLTQPETLSGAISFQDMMAQYQKPSGPAV